MGRGLAWSIEKSDSASISGMAISVLPRPTAL